LTRRSSWTTGSSRAGTPTTYRPSGVETICVITGGFSRQELEEAGAVAVFESVDELRRNLAKTPLSSS
jgi:phosphoglycolate phosphatase-like HAD superfamily hydrolase